jgi:hypothetical protein
LRHAATWQGRSLLAHNRPDRTYFFAGDHPAEIRDRIDRLAAWVQYQNRMYGRLMN